MRDSKDKRHACSNFWLSQSFPFPPFHCSPTSSTLNLSQGKHLLCVRICLNNQENIKVLARSAHACLRCRGYTSTGIRGRIWTGGTNKPPALLPHLLRIYFHSISSNYLTLPPLSQFIKCELIWQGVWLEGMGSGIADRQECYMSNFITTKKYRVFKSKPPSVYF